jgi:hypothetical protein
MLTIAALRPLNNMQHHAPHNPMHTIGVCIVICLNESRECFTLQGSALSLHACPHRQQAYHMQFASAAVSLLITCISMETVKHLSYANLVQVINGRPGQHASCCLQINDSSCQRTAYCQHVYSCSTSGESRCDSMKTKCVKHACAMRATNVYVGVVFMLVQNRSSDSTPPCNPPLYSLV